jgi:hypothetical protein
MASERTSLKDRNHLDHSVVYLEDHVHNEFEQQGTQRSRNPVWSFILIHQKSLAVACLALLVIGLILSLIPIILTSKSHNLPPTPSKPLHSLFFTFSASSRRPNTAYHQNSSCCR